MDEESDDYFSVTSFMTARKFLDGLRTNAVKELFGRTSSSTSVVSQRDIFNILSSKEFGLDMDDFCYAASKNTSITSIRLQVPENHPVDNRGEAERWVQTWGDFARAIGSLQNLREMELVFDNKAGVVVIGGDDVVVGDTYYNAADMNMGMAALFVKRACRLETLRVNFVLALQDNCDDTLVFASALQSHPSLKCIEFQQRTGQAPMDALSLPLGTMPQLSSIQFTSLRGQGVQFRTLPDSFFEHLSSVSNLRHLALRQCVLTQRQCELLSGPLLKNGGLQTLDLCDSMFLGSGGLALARALQKTNTLQQFSISLLGLDSKQVCEEMSKAFLANSDLRLVSIESVSNNLSDANVFKSFETAWFIPFFQALAELPVLKELHVCDLDRWTDHVADEFRVLLELPKSSIENLKILSYGRAPAWRRIEPCLRVNQALRSLTLSNCMDSAEAGGLVSRLKSSGGDEHPLEQLKIQTIDGMDLDYCLTNSDEHWRGASGKERVSTDKLLCSKENDNPSCKLHPTVTDRNVNFKGKKGCYIADGNNNASAISFDKESNIKRKYDELL